MKVVIKNNCMFGGYIGYLSTEIDTPVELPPPFNVSAGKYTGINKEKIINRCKRDAGIIFKKKVTEIKDLTGE